MITFLITERHDYIEEEPYQAVFKSFTLAYKYLRSVYAHAKENNVYLRVETQLK